MERVIIVGGGLYGLIAAKTYLQVRGAYHPEYVSPSMFDVGRSIPAEFTKAIPADTKPACRLLVVDAASDIGGTWAQDRLYPNLLSQNSYGLYEFSDMSLAETIPAEEGEPDQQFIPGWKINRYLHAWADKWNLKKHIRLKWEVMSITRLQTGKWKLRICIADAVESEIFCDKLILATGLTSIPHYPSSVNMWGDLDDSSDKVIHAKEVGSWSRKHLGYQPFTKRRYDDTSDSSNGHLKSVAVYGGAKSAFDLVHFFATLHRNDHSLNLQCAPRDPVEVHWIIRDSGGGPSWMVPPTSSLPNGNVVSSDKAASIRIFHYLSACCYEVPKRLCYGAWRIYTEGSWLARLFHGNPLGRWWVRWFWNSVDRDLEKFARYSTDSKMQLLRPSGSVITCGATFGIANQPDLWEAIRSPNVKIYRSSILSISDLPTPDENEYRTKRSILLADKTQIDEVDLVAHATGYKPIVSILFEPPQLRLTLGLSAIVRDEISENSPQNTHWTNVPSSPEVTKYLSHWKAIDDRVEPIVKNNLLGTGCISKEKAERPLLFNQEAIDYRLFRRMVAPELVAIGDRSFAALGILTSSTIAIIAEVQALWATAFLLGEFDNHDSLFSGLFDVGMKRSVSEDVVVGKLTHSGLSVDPIEYNDLLLRDLGLNPNRFGGSFKELTAVYAPSAYRGIVNEWLVQRDRGKYASC